VENDSVTSTTFVIVNESWSPYIQQAVKEKEQIKQGILNAFQKNNDYSFSELIVELEDIGLKVKGDKLLSPWKNLILWENTNVHFNAAIQELLDESKIMMRPLNSREAVWLYSSSSKRLFDLPITDRIEHHTQPHWLPTTIIRSK
jgi:hypothetical protein